MCFIFGPSIVFICQKENKSKKISIEGRQSPKKVDFPISPATNLRRVKAKKFDKFFDKKLRN